MTQIEQQNVPELRFPGFEGDWLQRPLRAFVDPKRKVTYGIVQPGDFVVEGVPLVRGGDYSGGWVPFEKIKRVTTEVDAPYKRSKLKGDDLLMTIVGANTGTIAKVPGWLDGANITQTTARIAVDDGFADAGYILQCLQSHTGQCEVRKYIKGAAQPGLNLSDVEKFRVPAPTLPEQRKIAEFLGAVDDRIAQVTRKKLLLEDYKKGCMQQLFSQSIRFKDDQGNDFPDWEEKRLGEVLTESSERGSKGHEAKKLTVKLWGRGVKAKDASGSENTQYYIRRAGQFIYSKLDFLNCAFGLIPDELDGYESTVDLPCFDIARGNSGKFLLERISQTNFYTKFGDTADGSRKAKRIHANTFLDFLLHLPHSDEQRKISGFLSAIDTKIDLVAQELEQAKAFKKGLLQQMFV